MDELTLEQARANELAVLAKFQGDQQQWAILNASIAKVAQAIQGPRASTNGQAVEAARS